MIIKIYTSQILINTSHYTEIKNDTTMSINDSIIILCVTWKNVMKNTNVYDMNLYDRCFVNRSSLSVIGI